REVPFVELRERLEPRHALAALALPEGLEVVVVDRRLGVRNGREVGRRRGPPLPEQEGGDRLVRLGRHPARIFAGSTAPLSTCQPGWAYRAISSSCVATRHAVPDSAASTSSRQTASRQPAS